MNTNVENAHFGIVWVVGTIPLHEKRVTLLLLHFLWCLLTRSDNLIDCTLIAVRLGVVDDSRGGRLDVRVSRDRGGHGV